MHQKCTCEPYFLFVLHLYTAIIILCAMKNIFCGESIFIYKFIHIFVNPKIVLIVHQSKILNLFGLLWIDSSKVVSCSIGSAYRSNLILIAEHFPLLFCFFKGKFIIILVI